MRRQRCTVRPDSSHAARGGPARTPEASCPDAGGRARRAQAREPPQSLAQSTRLDSGYRSAGDVSASAHPGEHVPLLSARRTNVVCAAGQTANVKSSKRLSDLEAHHGVPRTTKRAFDAQSDCRCSTHIVAARARRATLVVTPWSNPWRLDAPSCPALPTRAVGGPPMVDWREGDNNGLD